MLVKGEYCISIFSVSQLRSSGIGIPASRSVWMPLVVVYPGIALL
jgi:hypothetical protein